MQDNERQDDGHVEEVLRHSRAIRSETEALFSEVRAAADQLNRTLDLRGRMERHPYATMAAAVGVGYVLGGGLFTRFTGRMLHFGARAVLLPMIRQELQSLGASAFSGGPAEGYEGSEDGSGGM